MQGVGQGLARVGHSLEALASGQNRCHMMSSQSNISRLAERGKIILGTTTINVESEIYRLLWTGHDYPS